MDVYVHLKNAFQAELETEGSSLATIFGLPPTPHQGSLYGLLCRNETKRFFYSNPIQQNLWETAKSPETAKYQFERDSNSKISWSLF